MNANHPLQTLEWGEFRKKMGVKVIQSDSFQLTIHKIPYTPFNIGYLPKGPLPNKKMVSELKRIGVDENCIFIQLEPNIAITETQKRTETQNFSDSVNNSVRSVFANLGLAPSFHPLFTKYTFILDLTKSEEELLKNMHPKTRYNIRVAQKHEVSVVEDNSDSAFETYLKLTFETTKRQGFYAHDENYHRSMWQTLRQRSDVRSQKSDKLTAHLFLAKFRPPDSDLRPLILVAWIVFIFKDTIYYPYGASSTKHREVMASNLMMWEVIRWAKKMGLKKFDMWGSLGPNPDEHDPWFGFHRFKQGYGGKLVEFVGSYDLVIKPFWYQLYKIADKIRWLFLRKLS